MGEICFDMKIVKPYLSCSVNFKFSFIRFSKVTRMVSISESFSERCFCTSFVFEFSENNPFNNTNIIKIYNIYNTIIINYINYITINY